MIYTKIKNIERYLGQNETLDKAIRYLLSTDLSKLEPGKNEVCGKTFFVNRSAYETITPEQSKWEGHVEYVDLQVVISGREKIGVSNADSLTRLSYNPEKDFIAYEGPVETWFTMTPEDVLILYPEDAHMVKIIDGESMLIEKACLKVKL